MKQNIGTADRIIRIIVGLAIGTVGLYYKSWWGLLGLLPLGSAVVGFCGLYPLLGIDTCGKRKPKSSTRA
ncbi:MAG: YgaP family membrane protein [Candidatus Zixiibacteriota bacterium]